MTDARQAAEAMREACARELDLFAVKAEAACEWSQQGAFIKAAHAIRAIDIEATLDAKNS